MADEMIARPAPICNGDRFGELVVVREIDPVDYGRGGVRRFECDCSCGNKTTVFEFRLRNEEKRACGGNRHKLTKEQQRAARCARKRAQYYAMPPDQRQHHRNRRFINLSDEARRKQYESARKWRAMHPDKARMRDRKSWLKKQYGISAADRSAMMIAQDNKCKICREILSSPNVDHDHATGRVRGILCRSCNLGLGFLRDSKELALRAYLYLGEMM